MQHIPHTLTLQQNRDEGQLFSSIAALRLSRLATYDLVRETSDGLQSYTRGVLSRQIDFIGCLAYPHDGRSFDLRLVVAPDLRFPTKGSLTVGLLARTQATDAAAAARQTASLVNELRSLLTGGFAEYEFETVTDAETFRRIYRPFRFNHVSEIVRREEMIPLDSVIHERPQRRIGFQQTVPPSRQRSDSGNSAHRIYFVFPFVPTLNSLLRLAKVMMYQTHPVLVSVGLVPTRLTQAEEQAFDHLIGECERFWQVGANTGVPDPSRCNASLQVYAEGLRQAISSHVMRLQDAPFLIRIQLASSHPIPQTLIDALGVEITEVVGQECLETAPRLIQHLAGGYDWVAPSSGAQLQIAQKNLIHLDREIWIPSLAPEGLTRWLYLVDPLESNAAFRLPVPQPEDFPALGLKLSRTAPVPKNIPEAGLLIGYNRHYGGENPVYLPLSDRRRHLYAVGQTGTGKTTFFESMIMQDLRAGHGLCVLDPHGDLIERILAKVPIERADDVILFDANERDRPFGLNLLQWTDEDHKYFVAEEMLAIIRRLVPDPQMRGPMFEHFVRMAVLTLMANPADPGTLVEFPRMISDRDYHKRWLPFVRDPLVRQFWEHEYAGTTDFHKSEMTSYVVSKFDSLIFDPLMRNIIGQRTSSLDFNEIIARKKVLLVNLAKGRLGEMNSSVLGMILVAKFQAAALGRALSEAGEGHEYFIYVDEFQNVATDSFATLLSEARKYGLGLIITNQYITQLLDAFHDPKIVEAIIGNVGTLVCFRIGPKDADFIVPKYAPVFKYCDLLNLSNFEMYVASTISGEALRPFSVRLHPDVSKPDNVRAKRIRKHSLIRYGRPRRLVEAVVKKSLTARHVGARDCEPWLDADATFGQATGNNGV